LSVDEEIAVLRKRKAELEADLQKNSLMARAVDASSESIIIADINQPDQPIIYVNDAFLRMTGYSRGEV
jgi:PAS domain-containing protein